MHGTNYTQCKMAKRRDKQRTQALLAGGCSRSSSATVEVAQVDIRISFKNIKPAKTPQLRCLFFICRALISLLNFFVYMKAKRKQY